MKSRQTRRGDKYVTVVIDLTVVSTGTGPSRLLAMVEGRSKQAFKTWLAEQPQTRGSPPLCASSADLLTFEWWCRLTRLRHGHEV